MYLVFDDKNTKTDWGLNLREVEIAMPEPKTNSISLPGADGQIDLTEVLGDVRYENRTILFTFDASGTLERWHGLTSKIANYLHGQKRKVVLESDPSYYYLGRFTLDSTKSNEFMHQIVITGDVEPYKYELQSSLEDWLWDPFNFEDGIVREYKNLSVNGSRSVLIPARRKKVVPVLTCSAAMSVIYQGKTYPLKSGANKLYELSLPEGENTLVFTGQGTVSIDYQGGSL